MIPWIFISKSDTLLSSRSKKVEKKKKKKHFCNTFRSGKNENSAECILHFLFFFFFFFFAGALPYLVDNLCELPEIDSNPAVVHPSKISEKV